MRTGFGFKTLNPSYPVSNVPSLGAYVLNDVWYNDDGTPVPDAVAATLNQVESVAPGLLEQAKAESFDWNSFIAKATEMVGVVVQADAQRDILKINLQRAQQGLPPINTAAYMPGVNVGMTQDTKQLVYILGGVLAVALVLPPLLKGRR